MRPILIYSTCAASLMLALTPAASAADVGYAPEPSGPNWYVSVFGGWSLPDDIDVAFLGSSNRSYEASIDIEDGFMASLAVGARFNDWLRADVELSGHWHDVDSEAVIETSGSPTTLSQEGEVDALFVLANLWVDVPVGEVIRPYIGGGVGIGRLDVDINTTGGGDSIIDDSDWGFAYQLGAGIAFDVTPNMVIDVGYRFKAINAELKVEDDYFFSSTDTDADYRSHNVLLGLRFEL
ncbi:MAG: outer membrane protein [Aestuariivirgaceae bacterium]